MAKGRVLVMDDEGFIKDVMGSMLEMLDYEVDFANDGAQALGMYKEAMEKNSRFDAVIMDLTIPGGKGGKETIQDLLKLDANAKAIVSSGYSNDIIMSNFKAFGFAAVIAKPFQIEDLRKVLDTIFK